ncbi:cyclin N-terminal domain-containing protein 1 isoform X1 [Cygnus atratus]|uniref:cyclin N-terminal domain-containing protein 1 isoform X1 n=1 Tax=Cygnus atratus TaxID=8868 RepID=UPI0021B83565|nr:cyclin N-terminal domain-containing protein 1 isoform X1 [Cygnus atratus]
MARMGGRAQAVPRFYSSEPLFGGVAPEVMEAALIRLATENERYLSELPGQAGCCKESRTVEFVFLLAEKWHLDHSARYQAVELLERFMIKQVEQICKSPSENMESTKEGSSRSSLKEQMYATFVLRLVSCIQLASKLSLHYNIVNSDTALKFLQSLKYSYTKQELLESELAVLETLQFQINVSTPLAYIELLLEVLGHNGCLLPAKPLHQMCVQLLDFLYLKREAIYDTLLKTAIENSTPSELQMRRFYLRRAKFSAVKEDFMLLAVGIISTSVFVLNPERWKQVVEHLNCVTGITSQSISEFSHAVLKHVVGSSAPKQQRRK